jgi:hypothetical protein
MYDNTRLERFAQDAVIPWVTYEAAIWLYQHIDELKSVFEWGSGASTFFWLKHAKSIVSVEHQAEFFGQITEALDNVESGHLDYTLRRPHPEKGLSEDGNDPSSFYSVAVKKHFKRYGMEIDQFDDESFDIVFVDGRARASCLIRALPKVKSGRYLMLDNSNQEKYAKAQAVIPDSWERLVLKGWGRKDPSRPCWKKGDVMNSTGGCGMWATTVWRKP